MKTEKPAQNTQGYLLFNPTSNTYFFRVYTSKDKRSFKDYDIRHYDLKIQIIDNYSSLYEDDDNSYIDYPSRKDK